MPIRFFIINKKQKTLTSLKYLIVLLFYVLFGYSSYAQCAMCRAALNGESNQEKAEAINDGIIYLMVIPYILFVAVAYYIYKTKRKIKQSE